MNNVYLIINTVLSLIFLIIGSLILIKILRIIKIFRTEKYNVSSIQTLDRTKKIHFLTALRDAICTPTLKFHRKTNPVWTVGYCFYHIAIIMLVSTYALSFFIIMYKALHQQVIPNFIAGSTISGLNPLNILLTVFGNTEQAQAQFLFGKYAGFFIHITWFDIGCALLGNALLLFTVLAKRMGRTTWRIDKNQNITANAGTSFNQHLIVRVVIFFIIWTEIFARLDVAHWFVYFHTFFGIVLLILLPIFYINHILFFPFSIIMSAKKRQLGMIV